MIGDEPMTPQRYRRGGEQLALIGYALFLIGAAAICAAGYVATHDYHPATMWWLLIFAVGLFGCGYFAVEVGGWARGKALGLQSGDTADRESP